MKVISPTVSSPGQALDIRGLTAHDGGGIRGSMWMNRQADRRMGARVYGEVGARARGRKGNELEGVIELSISFYTGDRGGRKIKSNEQFSTQETRRMVINTSGERSALRTLLRLGKDEK